MKNVTIKQKIRNFLKFLEKKISYSLLPVKPVLIPVEKSRKNRR